MITAAILREHVETDLGDGALDLLIDDAYTAVAGRVGARTGLTYQSLGGDEFLFLDPPASVITSVTEDDVVLVLTTDYEVRWDGRALRRVGRAWGETTVLYDASASSSTDRVVIDLCKLALQYQGASTIRSGDYSETLPEYQRERESLLAQLTPGLGFR